MAGWIVIIVTLIVQLILAHALKVEFWHAGIFMSLGGISLTAYRIAEIYRRGGA